METPLNKISNVDVSEQQNVKIIAETIFGLKKDDKKTINLSVGQPSLEIPDFIQNLLLEATKKTNKEVSLYANPARNSELRDRIKNKYFNALEIPQNMHNQFSSGYSNGATQAFLNAISVLTQNSTDKILIPAPYWDGYQECVDNANRGSIETINCTKENNWKIKPEDLRETLTENKNIRCFVLNSPSNPTGAVYLKDELKKICEVLKDFPNITIISDEVYEHFIYGENIKKTPSILEIATELSNRTIIINSLSKTYSLCGHRIGYYFGPKEIIDKMNIIQSNGTEQINSISQETLMQIIELEINKDPVIENSINEHNKFYKENITEAYNILSKQNTLQVNKPKAGFYLFIDFSNAIGMKTEEGIYLNKTSDFYRYFTEKTGVQVRPGDLFGDEKFSQCFRISCAGNTEELLKACNKITEVMNELEKINQQSHSQTR